MALQKEQIKAHYPLPAYNYQVTFEGSIAMSFSEVSGLEIDYDHVLYRHGFSWAMGDYLIRGQRKPINISLKRGVARQRDFLYKWQKDGEELDVRVELSDEKGVPVVSWDVYRALPIKLNAPSFTANSSEVAIESMSLIAHDLKITYQE